MKITQVEITNFKNIKNIKLSFLDRTAIEGKNFVGKTNILDAISWVLTNYLFDGGQDLSSIKPLDNQKAEVRVKIHFNNNTSVEKTYKETWTKIKGTETLVLKGHETEYIINDIKVPSVKEALTRIKTEILSIDTTTKTKIAIDRALINPLYLFTQVEWKELRTFITELVGEATFDELKQHNDIKDNIYSPEVFKRLELDNEKIDNTFKFFKNSVKANKDERDKLQNTIDELSKIEDIDNVDETLLQYNQNISKIDELVKAKETLVNPNVKEILTKIELANGELNEQIIKDKEEVSKNNSSTLEEISKIDITIKEKLEEKDSYTKELNSFKNDCYNAETDIQIITNNLNNKKNKVEELRKRFVDVSQQELILPPEIKCSSCGTIQNQDEITQIITNHRAVQENILKSINIDGKKTNDEIEKLSMELDLMQLEFDSLKAKVKEVEMKIEKVNFELSILENKKHNLLSKLVVYTETAITSNLRTKIAFLNEELLVEKAKNFTSNIDNEIENLNYYNNTLLNILDKHKYYINTQNLISDYQKRIDEYNKIITDFEAKQILTELIMKAKIDILNEKIKKVFDDIDIVLLEANITEGSTNEVCYPLIYGKNTAFENGSRSEQYITAIKLIERIRKHLNIQELPILIDEAGTFDNTTITCRLETTSQIIATRCNDNYKNITINHL